MPIVFVVAVCVELIWSSKIDNLVSSNAHRGFSVTNSGHRVFALLVAWACVNLLGHGELTLSYLAQFIVQLISVFTLEALVNWTSALNRAVVSSLQLISRLIQRSSLACGKMCFAIDDATRFISKVSWMQVFNNQPLIIFHIWLNVWQYLTSFLGFTMFYGGIHSS